MDIVNFDALKAQGRIIDPSQVDPNEDYFIIGKYTKHYTTNSYKYTDYPVYAIKAGDVMGGGYTPPYKVYSALLTQSGIGDPTPIELENTLGNVIWTRDGFGSYIATLTGSFPQNKTWFISGGTVNIPFGGNTNATAFLYWNDINSIGLYANNGTGTLADNLLNYTSIEIRVYN